MSENRRVRVILEWTGRAPPHQTRLFAVARFDGLRAQWPKVAWSVVLYAPADGFQTIGPADVAMLADQPPDDLLQPGSAFDVMEGPNMVARALVS